MESESATISLVWLKKLVLYIFFKCHVQACVYVGVIRFQNIQSSLTRPAFLALAVLMRELIDLQNRPHATVVPVCTPCLLSLVSGVFGINLRVLIWSQLQQLSNDGCLGFCKQACWQVLLTSSQFICLVFTLKNDRFLREKSVLWRIHQIWFKRQSPCDLIYLKTKLVERHTSSTMSPLISVTIRVAGRWNLIQWFPGTPSPVSCQYY